MSIINNVSEGFKEYASNENGKKSLIALGAELACGIASTVAHSKGKSKLGCGLLAMTAVSYCVSRHYANKAEDDFTNEYFKDLANFNWDVSKVKAVNDFKQSMDERFKDAAAPSENA